VEFREGKKDSLGSSCQRPLEKKKKGEMGDETSGGRTHSSPGNPTRRAREGKKKEKKKGKSEQGKQASPITPRIWIRLKKEKKLRKRTISAYDSCPGSLSPHVIVPSGGNKKKKSPARGASGVFFP